MKKILVILLLNLVFISCATKISTFVQTSNVEWSTIQLRDGLSYESGWGEVLDIIAKRFEMELISKDGGYARTGWIYSWNSNGTNTNDYRVRVIIKFSADHTKVDLKTEAEKLNVAWSSRTNQKWISGYDTKLLQTIKTDIMGVVGRTTN
jgi:hypothetical protein